MVTVECVPNNEKRFPKSNLKEGDPDNFLTRVLRKIEKMRKERE